MSKQLTPILQLIYSAKELMLHTIEKLGASDTVAVSFISGVDDTPIPPALFPHLHPLPHPYFIKIQET